MHLIPLRVYPSHSTEPSLLKNVGARVLFWYMVWLILGDQRRGERQIKRAKSIRAEPGAKVYKTGGNSPWEDSFNGQVQAPICVIASDWAQILRHYIFVPNQRSAYFPVPFVSCYTECNLNCTQISCTRPYWNPLFCVARSIGLRSKKVLVTCEPKTSRNREIWLGQSRKKKTRYCEKFTP